MFYIKLIVFVIAIMLIIVVYEFTRNKVLGFFCKRKDKEESKLPNPGFVPGDFTPEGDDSESDSEDNTQQGGGQTPAPVIDWNNIYVSPNGDCYHSRGDCRGLRTVDSHRIAKKRPCLLCCQHQEAAKSDATSSGESRKTK